MKTYDEDIQAVATVLQNYKDEKFRSGNVTIKINFTPTGAINVDQVTAVQTLRRELPPEGDSEV